MPSQKEQILDLAQENRRLREDVYRHVEITNAELGALKADVEWLKRFFWVVATSSVGAFFAAIANLLKL